MDTFRPHLLALGLALAGCGQPTSGSGSGAEADTGTEATSMEPGTTGPTDATSSAGSSGDSQGPTSSAGETDTPGECRTYSDTTYSQWQRLVDPDHLIAATSVLALADGGVALAGQERIVRYDAHGDAIAIHHPQGSVRGLGHGLQPGTFIAVIETSELLRVTAYDPAGETGSSSVPFESGVVAYGMPLVQGDETTVLTMVRGTDEGAGILQFRDAQLAPTLELDVEWTLDTWAVSLSSGRTIVGSLDAEVTTATLTAYDGGDTLWSHVVPVADPDQLLQPHALAAGPAVFLQASTAQFPLSALDEDDGTVLWEETLEIRAMAKTPCDEVLAIVTGESFDLLYRLDIDGPHLLTQLTRPSDPHDADATITGLSVGPDGTMFVARFMETLGTGQPVANLMAY